MLLLYICSVLDNIEDGVSATGIEVKDFYLDYNNWAMTNNKEVLTVTKIGMILQRFMRTEYVPMTKDGETRKFYNGIRYRTAARSHMPVNSLVLSQNVKVYSEDETRLVVIDSVFVNDDLTPIQMSVPFDINSGTYHIYLNKRKIDNNELGLASQSFFDQIFIDGIVKVARQLRLCLGKPGFPNKIEKSDKAMAVEVIKRYQVGGGFIHVVFTRIKHIECLGFVNLLGSNRTTTCRPCQHKINQRFLMEVDSYVSSNIFDNKDDDVTFLIYKHGKLPMAKGEEDVKIEKPVVGGAMRYRQQDEVSEVSDEDFLNQDLLTATGESVGFQEVSKLMLSNGDNEIVDAGYEGDNKHAEQCQRKNQVTLDINNICSNFLIYA